MHKTISINVHNTTIKVDKKIAPIVSWINSFKDTYSLHSCQGDYLKHGTMKIKFFNCYCSFICFNQDSLSKILNKISVARMVRPICEIEYYDANSRSIFSKVEPKNECYSHIPFDKLNKFTFRYYLGFNSHDTALRDDFIKYINKK